MNATISDSRVVDKVLDGARITAEDAMVLYRLPLNELGQLADQRRQKAKAEAFQGRGSRDRYVHRRSQYQLHKRLQCLLQVLCILSNREGRRSLRSESRRYRSED